MVGGKSDVQHDMAVTLIEPQAPYDWCWRILLSRMGGLVATCLERAPARIWSKVAEHALDSAGDSACSSGRRSRNI